MPSTQRFAHSFTVLLAAAGATDVPMLTYDPDLSRVRVDQGAVLRNLVDDPGFEDGTGGWTPVGASLAQSTAFAHSGAASAVLTPDGATANPHAESSHLPVAAGTSYTAESWFYVPAAITQQVLVNINWWDASGTYITTSSGPLATLTAGAWTKLSCTDTAPAAAATGTVVPTISGTPVASDVVYLDDAAMFAGPEIPAGATRVVERSSDLIHWSTVRGGEEAPVDPAGLPVDDYEFAANTQNTYRIRVLVAGDMYWTFRDQITVTLDEVWLKSITYPFLNRAVQASTADPATYPAAGGVFRVVGRSDGVAVTDVRGSRQYTLTVATTTAAEKDAVLAVLAPGDVILLQAPIGWQVPDGYYWVGDVVEDNRKSADLDRRWWTLPLTQVAAPAPLIVGSTITWRGLANRYASWADVVAANPTWRDVLELRGTPRDVVVP
ncbi:MAG: carbohydrate binding domain-containing protein [Streptosporangiales bacterium]|nr:carbohydrate binding domain-containing protein [Streptosporangiales bacterium]